MTLFNRWELGWGRTAAHHLFQSHHTQLNALYWSHAPAFRHAFAATRASKPTDPTATIFSLPHGDAHRINYPLQKWAENYDAFDNWVRLNALVSATGYLEVYLKTVIRLALESDPGVMIGATHAVDGVRLLKNQQGYSYKDEVVDCVRGTWGARLASYRQLFGSVPATVEQSTGDLDRLRVLRNGVTHTFGRNADDYDSLLDVTPKPFANVSVKNLKKNLGLIETVALAVDQHLGRSHIGEYEALYIYHMWDRKYDRGQLTEDRALAAYLAKIYKSIRRRDYYRALIAHYRTA